MTSVNQIIRQAQRGLLYKDGQLVRWLGPGRHVYRGWFAEYEVTVVDLERGWVAATPELRAIVPESEADDLHVKANQLAIVTVDGEPAACLEPGRYLLWRQRADVRAWVVETDGYLADVPERFVSFIPHGRLRTLYVGESQRGVLYVDSKAVAWLEPGRHDVWARDRQVTMTTLAIDSDVQAIGSLAEIDALAPEHEATTLVVPHDHLAIVSRDGQPVRAAAPGRYLLWQGRRKVTATLYPTDGLRTEVPRNQWDLLGASLVRQVVVRPFERAVLYVDGRRVEVLEAGAHAFNIGGRQIVVHSVDMRERETQIQGQELMTADKVTLRVNLIVTWRVTDALASVESQTNLDGAIYSEAQMSARRYIAGLSVDELLEGRREASERMLERLAERAERWGVEVTQIDLKDVILPGEMKTLLNRVIEAEKKAAANVIMRREETAATRSQANTAKMLEANPTLMRLKELEAVREIAAEVGSVQIVAGTDGLLERFRLTDR